MSTLVLSLAHSVQQLALVSLEALDEVPAPEDVRPGWVAMGSFFLLFAVTILLWMNMRKQIGKIKFDDGVDRSGPADPSADGSGPDEPGPDDAPVEPAPPHGSGTPRG
ncbi:hypothetical protein G7072_15200 [Nocardioides sp. HDW12B]|uniref:hypothetical protein n=1 Tax=Nocardioides sp. HDW12B TaxID=2714939 RepID=UPI00140E81F9|nr:hypothetical protein [Nocardioides sp. HDW12B]QIK67514.1 hypothetical protein G7072_15200 [Nocardioides sp. HDW12B]